MPVDVSQHPDPLVRLGLIDISRIDAHDHPEGEEGGEAPAAPTQPAGEKPKSDGPDWDSDDNPYKQAAIQAVSRGPQGPTLEQQVAAVRAKANELVPAVAAQMVAMGTDERLAMDLARGQVNSEANAVIAELNRQNDRKVIFQTGAIQKAAAERLAKELSTKEVKINPKDLEDAPTMEVMIDRAKSIVEGKRASRFTARKAAGTDRVEGGAAPGAVSAEVMDKMTPEQKIAYGIKHGQY